MACKRDSLDKASKMPEGFLCVGTSCYWSGHGASGASPNASVSTVALSCKQLAEEK